MITQVKPINSSTDSVKENVESEKSYFLSKWKEFTSDTTVHGLRYTVQDRLSIYRRVLWFIFLCIAAAVYTYYSIISMEKYLSRPIKTVISQETPTGGLKFPAVSICNLNKFMKSKIDVTDQDEKFQKMGLNISGCSETRAVRGNLTCGQALLCAYAWYGPAVVKGCNETTYLNIIDVLNRSSDRLYNEKEFLTKYGHTMAGMFVGSLYCRFRKYANCSDKDFVADITPEGICFTFNSGRKGNVLHTQFEGTDLGLSILLDVQTNESTLGQFSTGLKVVVHDQYTFVNRHTGFNIFPGTHATVAVKLRKVG